MVSRKLSTTVGRSFSSYPFGSHSPHGCYSCFPRAPVRRKWIKGFNNKEK
jgi:hypothetical protein